jgi:RNA ligase (TIGR02306 family)
MSQERSVRVVRVGPVHRHENADTLSITLVEGGYPVVFRTGEFNEGDLAAYVPVDSVVPDTEQWAFLKGHRRIRAKKLRGTFSMGMLAPLPHRAGQDCAEEAEAAHVCFGYDEGQDITAAMGVVPYEPPMKSMLVNTYNEPDPGFLPRYTDIEGLRRYQDVLVLGEEVVITEKIHGANMRVAQRDGRLWVGSHNCFKKPPVEGGPVDIWWRTAREIGVEGRLDDGYALYGEVYGRVQDLGYGVEELAFRGFDVMDLSTGRYFDYHEQTVCLQNLGVEGAPVLYRGPWLGMEAHAALAEGPSTLYPGHVREGFVVRPVKERYDHRVGRVILKLHGQNFLLRKGTE